MDFFGKLLSFIPYDFIRVLRLNMYFNTYFNDPASLYMEHMITFHNKLMMYLVIVFTVICIFLVYLFTPLMHQYLSRRSLYVDFLNSYYFLPIRVYIIYYLSKLFICLYKFVLENFDDSPLQKRFVQECVLYPLYYLFGFTSRDQYNNSRNFLELRADVFRSIKSLDHNQILFLMKDCSEWELTLNDVEIFVLQKQASNITDNAGLVRGYYWSLNGKRRKDYRFNLYMKNIISLTNLTSFVDVVSNNLLVNPRLRIYKSWFEKQRHLFESAQFVHSRRLEWFFFFWPTAVVFKVIIPSVALICESDTEIIEADCYVKVIGSQWYWSYEYDSWEKILDFLKLQSVVKLLKCTTNFLEPYSPSDCPLSMSADDLETLSTIIYAIENNTISEWNKHLRISKFNPSHNLLDIMRIHHTATNEMDSSPRLFLRRMAEVSLGDLYCIGPDNVNKSKMFNVDFIMNMLDKLYGPVGTTNEYWDKLDSDTNLLMEHVNNVFCPMKDAFKDAHLLEAYLILSENIRFMLSKGIQTGTEIYAKYRHKFPVNNDMSFVSENSKLNKNLDKIWDYNKELYPNDVKFKDYIQRRFPNAKIISNYLNIYGVSTDYPTYIPNLRLLNTTNNLVLPTNIFIKLLVTSSDVLHSWAVPNLGIKMDAAPGRLNAVSLYVTSPGEFVGQCSELCGPSHYAMPITVKAVSFDEYYKYLEVMYRTTKIDRGLRTYEAVNLYKANKIDLSELKERVGNISPIVLKLMYIEMLSPKQACNCKSAFLFHSIAK